MRILFICPYPFDEAPSQRFRFEQYFQILKKEGIEFEEASFWDLKTWKILYQKGHWFTKIWGYSKGFLKRIRLLTRLSRFDRFFIHREALPFGPPVFEWVLVKIFRRKFIYDFDDAIWLPNTSDENKYIGKFKVHSKIRRICRMADKVSCGNKYLSDYASEFNSKVILNPTTVDTENYHNRLKAQITDLPVVGWTGTHTTLPFLDYLVPVFEKLEKSYQFRLNIISNKTPNYRLKNLTHVKWTKESEIEDLLDFNIGIMPMPDNEWTRGKCGFKILQYMALGIPALASPVGVNDQIIDDGVSGFLCKTEEEWEENIIRLLNDAPLRERMGKAAREKIVSNYSLGSNSGNFLFLFR